MIQVRLWTFNKRRNSTAQPPTSGGVVQTGEIKSDFSVSGLEVTFNFGTLNNTPVYNYAYIPSLRRYYFITDWWFNAGLWVAVCAVDVLATYKAEIGNSTQYVTRAENIYSPGIIDAAYPTTGEVVREADYLYPENYWGANPRYYNSGLIVLGVVGASASGMGAVTYYAMKQSVFNSFIQSMLSSIEWANISVSEISEDLQKALINPTQYITYCKWFPIDGDSFAAGFTTNTIYLGWWSFSLSGTARVINNVGAAIGRFIQEFAIPKHPQHTGRTSFVQLSPFSTYTFKFLPFGVFELDTTDLFDKDTLGVEVHTNLMTGDAVLKLAVKNFTDADYDFNNAILVTESQIGVSLPVGQVSADMGNFKNALQVGAVTGLDAIISKFKG